MEDKVPSSCSSARRSAKPLGVRMHRIPYPLAVAMMSVTVANAADPGALQAAEESEEIQVSEHPPRLVYFRSALPVPSRIARKALARFCRERASPSARNSANLEDGSAIAYFCSGRKPAILMGVDFRDEFNKTLYACRSELDLNYIAYPIYWAETFNDSHWCARIEYDYGAQYYRVTQ